MAELLALGAQIGYPLIVKAAAGGGGKGMKVVHGPDEAERAFEAARGEGLRYFADDRVYAERYLPEPRHVEVQVMADAHGNVVHLGERDCTIQRRHQKLLEETPSPAVDAELRERIGAVATSAARAATYRSAGTIEGLLTREGEYFFLEMNTRIQVEHTVTEMVTGLDLVREQVMIAAGAPLSFRQEHVVLRGHAIECRINAEDVAQGFLPGPGLVTAYREPGGPGVRVDSGIRRGDEVSGLYDPLLAKVIVHDTDRESARRRMIRALRELTVEGPPTLRSFHLALLEHPCFAAGEGCHGVVESEELAQRAQELDDLLSHERTSVRSSADGAGALPTRERLVAVEVDGRAYDVRLHVTAAPWAELARRRRDRGSGHGGHGTGAVVSPMQGTVLKIEVAEGDVVELGQVLLVVEAMKMENEIASPRPGMVRRLGVKAGEQVASGQLLCEIADDARETGSSLWLESARDRRPRASDHGRLVGHRRRECACCRDRRLAPRPRRSLRRPPGDPCRRARRP